MKKLQFKEKEARKHYKAYMKKAEKFTRVLSKSDKNEVMMEINSHIHEGMSSPNASGNEVQRLSSVTRSLGDPSVIFQPMVAERKLKQATRTFNPKHIFQALFLNIKNGFAFILFSVLYLGIFSSLFLVVMKIMDPENTGMFFKDGEFQSLGQVYSTDGGYVEVLGDKFIPIVIISAIALYILLTLCLRIFRK